MLFKCAYGTTSCDFSLMMKPFHAANTGLVLRGVILFQSLLVPSHVLATPLSLFSGLPHAVTLFPSVRLTLDTPGGFFRVHV